MADNAVPHGIRQHEILRLSRRIEKRFNFIDDTQSLLLMPERFAQLIPADFLQYPFTEMPEGRMALIMTEGNGADKLRVEPQINADRIATELTWFTWSIRVEI